MLQVRMQVCVVQIYAYVCKRANAQFAQSCLVLRFGCRAAVLWKQWPHAH